MAELWQNFITWLTETGFDNIVNWLLTGGLGTIAIVIAKGLKDSKAREVIANKTSELVSNAFEKAMKEIVDYINQLQAQLNSNEELIGNLNKQVESLKGSVVVLLSNAKISPQAKKQAIELAKCGEKIGEVKVKQVQEVVNDIIEVAEQVVDEETVQEQEKESELDILIKEVGI
jgi:NAD(P)-dependent dehydrogenase (short-subunit alcohol dehydrogenase family)